MQYLVTSICIRHCGLVRIPDLLRLRRRNGKLLRNCKIVQNRMLHIWLLYHRLYNIRIQPRRWPLVQRLWIRIQLASFFFQPALYQESSCSRRDLISQHKQFVVLLLNCLTKPLVLTHQQVDCNPFVNRGPCALLPFLWAAGITRRFTYIRALDERHT